MENDVLELIQDLELEINEKNIKPHRFALFLAISKLYEKDPNRSNNFFLDDELEQAFKDAFCILSPNTSSTSAMIEYPYFHLQTSGYWYLHIIKGKENEFQDIIDFKNARFTKHRLRGLVSHASLHEKLVQFLRNEEQRELFNSELKKLYFKMRSNTTNSPTSLLSRVKEDGNSFSNPFVGYLNSLQQVGGSNENALAESQACNDYFSYLHVDHPLTQTIFDELKSDSGNHVILTGHAGDGKSTLAIDVLKKVKGMDPLKPFDEPIKPREDIEDSPISIVKDLSERKKTDDADFVKELVNHKRRFLLVSNTGTLLNLLKEHHGFLRLNESALESKVLEAISNKKGVGDLNFNGVIFKVFNLSLMDNLDLARQIFERMLAQDRWAACANKECRESCPICINVDLIHRNKARVADRVFLAYRRMYEYGGRLTLRQITEHLAYMITSGLEEADISELQKRKARPLKIEYLFFNRFFGDNGGALDPAASNMKAIREIRDQGFGDRPSPLWEHRLWLKTYGQSFAFDMSGCQDEFEQLRKDGSRNATKTTTPGITPGQAREQVRRLLYFLHGFEGEKKDYLGQYLNSPTLLNWVGWQNPSMDLGFNEKSSMERKIYHVLQEHFTGVRLPEGSMQNDRRLYITLSRRKNEVRQSAQIVLAQVDWSTATDLQLTSQESANGLQRKELALVGKETIRGIDLSLSVPFLDYVIMRHFGELGEVLQASYIERLNRYKARLQRRIGSEKNSRIMLVHLKTDHTFRRQKYGVNNGRLEVSDVL
ncbi:conserved hypothetical protein [Candidatus Desulfarcum epimagneticum]|uniref:Uncharacterized protein n=1 Tax=uncultured Desulfobacteraceae bacterium TaxID=218296 RepID=A0A484HI82_9BACT|nr:conserved hypothetical protein [uncultured Desulfobacteraceae bacterium]